jgi:multidrug resistance efflux pump
MRILSLITAALVALVLYALVFERDRLMAFTREASPVAAAAEAPAGDTDSPEATSEAAPGTVSATVTPATPGAVRVMALSSVAQEVDSAVVLRGESEAIRQVVVSAETSGKVVSEPLRRGTEVMAGDLLCEIDPGTRAISRAEAEAKLAEARASLPEARARLAEAQASVPAARASILQAKANVPAAEASLLEAQAAVPAAAAQLKQAEAAVPAARAALAEAEAAVPTYQARITEAQARLKEAEINLTASQQLSEQGFAAQTRLAGSEATFESARAALQSAQAGLKTADARIEAAKSQLQSALAGVETAKSGVEGAKAAVESAKSGVEGAKAAVAAAEAQLESAQASVQAALTGEDSARSAIQSAEAAVASADQEIDRVSIHAPFAGLLETDTAELGELMQPGAACATVIQLDPVKLVAYVPETEISRVHLDAPAGARLVDGREVTGTVSFVSRSADEATRTFRVDVTLPNPDLSIRDGQTVEIAIEADGAPGHLLPQSALTLDDEGALGVRTVSAETTALFTPVEILRDTREGVWVTGLPDEVDVIILGQEYVTDGVPVIPSFEDIIQ